ncbi:MAG: ParB/RepB/Spo0J family partition protein [Holosporales bacterium]|jgi:ParB family chromosome partitioning protein|nr:ParB/RepB/Spo0J family partition protein [Holosporales bacterium]
MSKTLGKGLAELFRDTSNREVFENESQVAVVSVTSLSPSRFQPRKHFEDSALEALSASIKEKGILQPILVRKSESSNSYQIIAGERRWRAAQKAGLTEVPIILHNLSDSESLESALLENIQREDLNPIEEAEGYNQLIAEFGYTQDRISKFSGKSRSHLANILRLLTLPIAVRNYLIEGNLSFGHARALVGISNAEDIAKKVIKHDLNVRQTEQLVKSDEKPTKTTGKRSPDPELQELQSRLGRMFNLETKISISSSKGNGYIQIKFDSLTALDEVIEKLSKRATDKS